MATVDFKGLKPNRLKWSSFYNFFQHAHIDAKRPQAQSWHIDNTPGLYRSQTRGS